MGVASDAQKRGSTRILFADASNVGSGSVAFLMTTTRRKFASSVSCEKQPSFQRALSANSPPAVLPTAVPEKNLPAFTATLSI
jgi:hypothetical protein